jgi:Kef-type K+ transport system membrane component KefB
MLFLLELSLPLKDPVMLFAVVLIIILFAPILFGKLHLPSIIGLIVAGMLIGPHGFNLLSRDASIVLFGTVGLLYIMFLAGMEIDLNDFKKNRNRSLTFGVFTFTIPMILGTLAAYFILRFSFTSSILLASMFASHTLLTYPLLGRFGITRNEAVSVTVGGTMITDTAALLVLAVIAGSVQGELNALFWIKLVLSFSIFAFLVLWGVPRLGSWFFKNLDTEGGSQFIFVLAVVFTSAALAELAGVEPIIGAFLAGLALNRLVPNSSPLMHRLEFVGNTLFIPFFLISVGMLVNIRVIFEGIQALLVAATMTAVAISSKWLAAYFTQKTCKYTAVERNLIFGLSNAQAAATLAAVLIGYNLKLLDENVLNGTILMILITCLVSSLVTQQAGKKQAVLEKEKAPDVNQAPERILLPVSDPRQTEELLELALMIKNPASAEPIYPLVVVKDDAEAKEKIMVNRKLVEKYTYQEAAATENRIHLVSRVDYNIAGGILRAIKEIMITVMIINWNARITTRERMFGSVLDQVLLHSQLMCLVSRLVYPLHTVTRIVVVVAANAEIETGFPAWIQTLQTLSRQTGAALHFYGARLTLERIKPLMVEAKPAVTAGYSIFEDWSQFLTFSDEVTPDDLFMVISARRGTLSHNRHLDRIPALLAGRFNQISFIVLYPQQNPSQYPERIRQIDQLARLPLQNPFKRLSRAGLLIRKAIRGKKKIKKAPRL